LTVVLAGLIPSNANLACGANLARYVSPDFCAVFVIHPERTQNSTLITAAKSALPAEAASVDPLAPAIQVLRNQKDLPQGMDTAKLAKLLLGKPIHRIVVLFDPVPAANVKLGVGMIVQFGADVDGEGILSAITSQWQSADVEGVQYKKLKNPSPGQPDFAALAPDSQTLIAGLDVTVVKMLAKNQGERPLLKQMQQSSFNNDILVEFLAAPLLAKLPAATGKSLDETLAGLGNPALAALAKDVQMASIKLNFSGDTLAHAEVVNGKPESAAMLLAMTNMGVGAGKAKFEDFKKKPPPAMLVPPPLLSAVSKVGDEVFAGLTVKADGPKLVLDLPMPESLPELMKQAAALGAKMAPH